MNKWLQWKEEWRVDTCVLEGLVVCLSPEEKKVVEWAMRQLGYYSWSGCAVHQRRWGCEMGYGSARKLFLGCLRRAFVGALIYIFQKIEIGSPNMGSVIAWSLVVVAWICNIEGQGTNVDKYQVVAIHLYLIWNQLRLCFCALMIYTTMPTSK